MKLAWLCYSFTLEEDEEEYKEQLSNLPKFLTEEPESWRYSKVVPIVYAEIEEN